MDKIRLSIFDTFGFLIPGFIFAVSIFILLNNSIISVVDLIEKIKVININLILLFLFVSYVLGFATFAFGRYFYETFGCRLFKVKISDRYSENSEKYCAVRHFSESNYSTIYNFNALKTMAQSLSFSAFILTLISFIKFFISSKADYTWLILSMISLVICIILLSRAKDYHIWRHNDLNATYEILKKNKIIE